MSPTVVRRLADVPARPGVYVMYGGAGRDRHAAYVGVSKELRGRLRQHLVLRDSSVVTGTSATGLNIDHVREIEWYVDDRFADRVALDAAERVAEERFNPALRSRGRPRDEARLLTEDAAFVGEMNALFATPSGVLVIPTLADLIERVESLEQQISRLTGQIEGLGSE